MLMRRLTAATVVAAAALVSACSDSVSPDSVNTSQLAADVTTLSNTFDNNAAYQSLASLSLYFPSFAATSAFRATLPPAPTAVVPLGHGIRPSLAFAAPRPQLSGANTALVIPLAARGTTWVWSTDSTRYVKTATAGPANGIRLMLYVVDQGSGQPLVPLQEIGYVDLLDESTNTADQLGVILKLGATTIADYSINLVTSLNSAALTANGYLRNPAGTEQVDFDLYSFDDYTTGGGDFQYTLSASSGAQVVVDVHDAGDGTGTGLVRVSKGGNSVELGWTQTVTGMTGTVKFNGTVVANITQVGANDPVFTGVGGHELTAQQQADITTVFGGALLLVLVTLFGIFGPAYLFY